MEEKRVIEKAAVGWSETVVMICSKCGDEFEKNCGKESPDRLRGELKFLVKSLCGKRIRVLSTTCLSMCPENKLAIAVTTNTKETVFQGYVVSRNVSAQEVFDLL